MKYIISWFERPQGSPIEYENAQKRILEVFGQWKAPANFKIPTFSRLLISSVERGRYWRVRLPLRSVLSLYLPSTITAADIFFRLPTGFLMCRLILEIS